MGEKEAQGARNRSKGREHRTEVTEVTEGGMEVGVKLLAGMRLR
jgi:hypothetical protein